MSNGEGGAPGYYETSGNDGAEGAPGYWAPPQPLPSVNVDAIDQNEEACFWDEVLAFGEIDMRNTTQMVDDALGAAGDNPLGTLTITDHGGPGRQQIGDEQLSVAALNDPEHPEMREAMQRLYGHFGEDGKINLGGCEVGAGPEGEALAREVVGLTGVPVSAGLETQNPLPGYEGPVLTCYPPVEEGAEIECDIDGVPTEQTLAQ